MAEITREQRRTLVAAALGRALDAFDVMLYATVLSYVMRDLGVDQEHCGEKSGSHLEHAFVGTHLKIEWRA